MTKRTNKGRINCGVVIRAVPSDPRKRPKKPATELPRRGKNTISRYIISSVIRQPEIRQ